MITNKDRFPDVDFVPENQIRPIGTVGGDRLVYLGKQQGTGSLVVSRSYAPQFTLTENFFAIPLDELLVHSQDPITITEEIV